MKATSVFATLFCMLCIGCGHSTEDQIAIDKLKQKIEATQSELVRQRSELAVQKAKYRFAHNSAHQGREEALSNLGQETQEELSESVKKQESSIKRLEEELQRDKKLLAEIQ